MRLLNLLLTWPSPQYIFGVHMTCIRLAIETRLYERVVESEKPTTVRELAADGCAEQALILSIARGLVAKEYLDEATTDEGLKAYVPTATTRHMIVPSVRAGFIFQ